MSIWDDLAALEPVEIVGGQESLMVGVVERPPAAAVTRGGQTEQRFELLLPEARRIQPPTRLLVRGLEMRVLGTQMPPWPDAPAIITCQQVNPDLPDDVELFRLAEQVLDVDTNRMVPALFDGDEGESIVAAESVVWSGGCHVSSGDARLTETAEEQAPLDRVTITCATALAGADLDGLWARVTHAVNPAVAGVYKIVGEALDSTSRLRRLVGERKGWL